MSRIKPFEYRSVSRPRPLALSLIGLSIALGACIAAANADAAAGPDAAATGPVSSTAWCITQRDGSRTCYESLFTCIIAGIAHAGETVPRFCKMDGPIDGQLTLGPGIGALSRSGSSDFDLVAASVGRRLHRKRAIRSRFLRLASVGGVRPTAQSFRCCASKSTTLRD
jgi:hypothetical protein